MPRLEGAISLRRQRWTEDATIVTVTDGAVSIIMERH